MIYEIMSRDVAYAATEVNRAPDTAIISITDYGSEYNRLHHQEWLKGVLELQFNDVNEHGWRCITKQDAEDIARFANLMYSKVERIIVHCEYGISRSAGVAAAISEFYEGHDNGIFADKANYSPNITCYRYVQNALERIGYKGENEDLYNDCK